MAEYLNIVMLKLFQHDVPFLVIPKQVRDDDSF